MKSRISIDCDENNKPFINIEYCQSNDLRDKMVGRFLEGFGGDSTLALFQFGITPENFSKQATIHPLNYEQVKEEVRVHDAWIKEVEAKSFKYEGTEKQQ